MRIISDAVMMVAILFLTSCASMPTQQEFASADYGRYPDNYEQIIKAYLEPLTTSKRPIFSTISVS